MRVCLDISAGLGQGAGIGRYALQLALALYQLADRPELRLFHNRQPLDRLPPALTHLQRSQAPFGNKAWRLYLLSGMPLHPSWRTAINESDLFHGADALAPRLYLPTFITIHDLTTLLYPRYHTWMNRTYQRWALPLMARRSSAIIADSRSTQQDIVRLLGVPSSKVTVVHLGVDTERFIPRTCAGTLASLVQIGVRQPYLLAVGTLEPRKNLAMLLQAYARLPSSAPKLVLAGGIGWGDNSLSALVEQLNLKERVHLPGYVPDELLPGLYGNAELYVYPSLYEGFGLPVLEAMACGAPVITSNVSSLPEVAGEAAIQVNPRNASELAEAIQTLLESPSKRSAMRQAGLARAQSFSWERCAQETLSVYRGVLDNS